MIFRKDMNMNHLNRKEHELTPNAYFTCATFTTIFGSLSSHVVETSKSSDKLGQWNAIKLKHEMEKINVTNMHSKPDGSGRGMKTCSSQHNRITGIEHTTRKHRKELLNDIKTH